MTKEYYKKLIDKYIEEDIFNGTDISKMFLLITCSASFSMVFCFPSPDIGLIINTSFCFFNGLLVYYLSMNNYRFE